MSTNSLLAAERARLEEERLAAIIEGIELDLELGRHGELLGQLDALVIAHPFKERLVELEMLALYRCGRQADALAAFQAARARFVEELGIEPGHGLRDLHEDVLKHSAELSSPVDTTAERTVDGQPQPPMPTPLSDRRLPVPPNRTVGREHDVAAVGEQLRAGPVRLLTLTGPGGVGKTRLALEAARAVQADFADGAHFVSLAAQRRPHDVPAAIISALGIIVLPGESADQAAERFLAAKHLLLLTDNLEHLLEAAPFIARLLEACPALTVLATSRAPLTVRAEERYPVSPLALPEPGTPADPQALADTDAVTLFCERARVPDPDFRLSDANANAVAEICRRVDGLPLAIELAAARCGVLSPAEIGERLDAALGALGTGARDAPTRQRTLRATIDWSHDLLSEAEKHCFARFALFAGGASVEAAEAITNACLDTLDGLIAKNLLVLRRDAHARSRLGMKTPGVVLADAGCWHQRQMERAIAQGSQVLIPPDTGKRKTPRPGWTGGYYAFMRRVLAGERGGELYGRRQPTIEPVFGQTKHNRGMGRFHRRGRGAVRTEWRLITATHNLLKLHRHALIAA